MVDESNMVIIKMHVHDYLTSKEISLEMEKKKIIDAWHNGYNNQSPMIDEENCGDMYYNKTYESKESDDHIVDINEMVNRPQIILGEHSIQMVEISDEEIIKLANEYILYNDSKRQWVIEGMKLYREQLKKK